MMIRYESPPSYLTLVCLQTEKDTNVFKPIHAPNCVGSIPTTTFILHGETKRERERETDQQEGPFHANQYFFSNYASPNSRGTGLVKP